MSYDRKLSFESNASLSPSRKLQNQFINNLQIKSNWLQEVDRKDYIYYLANCFEMCERFEMQKKLALDKVKNAQDIKKNVQRIQLLLRQLMRDEYDLQMQIWSERLKAMSLRYLLAPATQFPLQIQAQLNGQGPKESRKTCEFKMEGLQYTVHKGAELLVKLISLHRQKYRIESKEVLRAAGALQDWSHEKHQYRLRLELLSKKETFVFCIYITDLSQRLVVMNYMCAQ